jgi:ribosome biogenesis GTPase / thiamine phosphate phosphatase
VNSYTPDFQRECTDMTGLVMRSTGSWYEVRSTEGELFSCRLKGKFKIKGLQTSNPIAVGDRVQFDLENELERTGTITDIEPRDNYIIRKSVHKAMQAHVLAANIDQAVLIATLKFPKTSLGFIDRFLVTAESFRIPSVIVFNKIDLLNDDEKDIAADLAALYEPLGYTCLFTSVYDRIGIQAFGDLLQGQVSLVSGHSGVGKSSLVNAIAPDLGLRTGEVSTFANKGTHTTTFAEMFELATETFLIDTPGIKELGLIDIEKEELGHFFPEMRAMLGECRFHNCLHVHEPGCAVVAAVEQGDIAESRYISYLSMLENDDNRR